MIVDKTKMDIDVIKHENIDNTNNINLVLASVEIETINEAFEEEDNLAVRETDQESRGIRRRILLGSVMVKATSEMEDNHKDSDTA